MKHLEYSNKASHPYDGPSASQEQFRRQLSSWQAMIGAPDWNRKPLTAGEYRYYENRARKIRSRTFRDLFRAVADRINAHRQQSKNIRELTALSERELMDIGISRADVYGVVSGAVTIDELNSSRDAARNSGAGSVSEATPKPPASTLTFPEVKKRIPAACNTEIVGHAA